MLELDPWRRPIYRKISERRRQVRAYIYVVLDFVPTILLLFFFLTLNFNPTVLYAPSDFKDDSSYLIAAGKVHPRSDDDSINFSGV